MRWAPNAMAVALAATTSSSCLSGCAAFAPPSSPHCTTVSPSTPMSQFASTHATCRHIHCNSRLDSTSLHMGIRSFIKKRILRRGGDGGDAKNDDANHSNADGESSSSSKQNIDLRTVLQSPKSAGFMESPISNYQDGDGDANIDNNTNDEIMSGDSSSSSSTEISGSNNAGSRREKARNKRKKNIDDDVLTNDMKQRLQEDAKERIRRVQTGGLTEEEKMAFLTTALTRTQPPPKPRGPPIRQKIPGMPDEDDDEGGYSNDGSDGDATTTANYKSSTEGLWNAIRSRDIQNKGKDGSGSSSSGGQSKIPVASLIVDGKLKSEEAKRQWIDSITSPDRFSTFSTYQDDSTASDVAEFEDTLEDESYAVEDDVVETEDGVLDNETKTDDEPAAQPDFTEMKRRIAEDQQIFNAPKEEGSKAVRDALESILSMTKMASNKKGENDASTASKNADKEKKADDLASRLEQAAAEQETRVAETRLANEKKALEKAEDEKRALKELQKQREAEFLRKENERMEAARKQAEALRMKEEAKKEAERAKMEAMQAQQDAYWAKQLEKQRAKGEGKMTPEERRMKEQKAIVNATESAERMERDMAKEIERENIRNEERMREDPHEGQILKEAEEEKLRDRELAQNIIAESAARVSRTVPRPSKEDASVSSFVQEQRRKKEELDRLAQAQQQQLKSLNSPLPSPQKPPIGMSPLRPPPPVARPPSPAPMPKRVSPPNELSLASLTMKKSTSTEASPPTPAPAKSSANSAGRLSLNELTRLKKTEDAADQQQTPPPLPSPGRLNLFEMTKLKKDTASSSSPVEKKKPIKARQAPLKKPVRQQIPISSSDDDDVDHDDDDFMRGGGASGMTVADYLKTQKKDGGNEKPSGGGSKKNTNSNDRAKQWGIDMSKFT